MREEACVWLILAACNLDTNSQFPATCIWVSACRAHHALYSDTQFLEIRHCSEELRSCSASSKCSVPFCEIAKASCTGCGRRESIKWKTPDGILHLEFLWQTPLPLLLLGVKLEEQHASLALALFILTGRKLGGDYHRFVWLKVVQLWGPAGREHRWGLYSWLQY